MAIELLKKILDSNLDSGVSIVSNNGNEAHIANTWVSFVKLVNNTLWIPVGGMNKTEEFLKKNDVLILSFCNREIPGTMYNGCGVHVKGNGKIKSEGEIFEAIKKEFDWARAVLVVDIKETKQVL